MNLQNQHETDNTAEQTSDKLTTAAASRRKFLVRASAASLPVIASVQSGSAWGCVDLKCTPGQAALSTSGSAVASAVANKVANYPARPQWSQFGTIDLVISEDYNKYLVNTFFRKKTLFVGTVAGKRTAINDVSTKCKDWLDLVKTNNVYSSQTSTTRLRRNDSYDSTATRAAYGNGTRIVVPGFYDPSIMPEGSFSSSVMWILSSTKFQDIFNGNFNGTVGLYKDSSYPFIAAAFLGAVWERHPEYKLRFKNRKLCYPTPQEIVNKFKSLKTAQQRKDMETLFEYYTNGTVNGKKVG